MMTRTQNPDNDIEYAQELNDKLDLFLAKKPVPGWAFDIPTDNWNGDGLWSEIWRLIDWHCGLNMDDYDVEGYVNTCYPEYFSYSRDDWEEWISDADGADLVGIARHVYDFDHGRTPLGEFLMQYLGMSEDTSFAAEVEASKNRDMVYRMYHSSQYNIPLHEFMDKVLS